MKKSVKKVIQWVDDKLEVFIGAVFLALMVVFTTLQIVGRYLFSTPFPWTEEMTRYMFVWMVFISIGYAVKTGEHTGDCSTGSDSTENYNTGDYN